jgi:hypothetical protein
MRSLTAPELAYIEADDGRVAHALIWITARNRSTGLPETMGLWTGEDHATFVIDGSPRLYFGAGTVVEIDDLTYAAGLTVQMQTARLSVLTPEVDQLLRGYDARLAPVEIHRALFYAGSGALVADPQRLFRGRIEEQPIATPVKGGPTSVQIRMASSVRELTRTLTLMKSDAALRARAPGDRFRQYNTVSGAVDTAWGESTGRTGGSSGGGSDRPPDVDWADPTDSR